MARSCAARKSRADSRNAAPWADRRSFDQLLAEPIFQPPQRHADGTLRGAERLGRARETLEIGNCHERLDGIDIQRGHAN
jgi:hypothetical protein